MNAAALLVSHWRPVFVPRFLLVCLPASVLLGAEGFAVIRAAWLRNAAITLLVVASLVGVRSYYRHPPVQDWRGAVAYITQNASADDTVIFAAAHYQMPFDYYRGRSPNVATIKIATLRVNFVALDSKHLWLILCGPPDSPTRASIAQLAMHYRLEGDVMFQGIEVIDYVKSHPAISDKR